MNLFRKVSVFLIASVMMFLAACSSTKEPETFHGVVFPVSVYSDVVIEEAFVRTAEYPEDGSFEKKKDVFALKVRNESDKAIQLLRIKVTTDKKEMLFEITTLPVNMSVNVFEKNGQTIDKNEKIINISGENRVDFEKPVGLKREIFELDVHDKVINVKNISKNDIESDIYLYYKKKDIDGSYFGGITFRSKIDGLKAGELKQIPASHFALTDSEVIYLDYAGE